MDRNKMEEILECMEDHSMGLHYFFDKETLEIITFTSEDMRLIEEDLDSGEFQDWEIETTNQLIEIMDNEERYVEIRDEIIPMKSYRIIDMFVSCKIKNKNIQEKFLAAIDGKGAFGRFFKLLNQYPDLQSDWIEYNFEQKERYVIDWCERNNIALPEGYECRDEME